jgi:ribokinase
MAVYTLGSINIDHVYRVPHLPKPGETLAADSYTMGLGGKGANQSVAAARAGAPVFHIGAVGPEGGWALDQLQGYGVDTSHVARIAVPTGHAIINVDPGAENAIVLFPGANQQITEDYAAQVLAAAKAGDTLMMQNETSAQAATARLAASKGLRVMYSAAPFEVAALRAVLPYATLLLMNEGEAAELRRALGAMPETDMVITKGAKGAEWISAMSEPLFVPSFKVTPVDTTGAGDCFAGTIAAALDAGLTPEQAMRRAAAAAAIQVTRPGAAAAMPTRTEVDAFLDQ